MARSFNGSSQYLASSGAPVSAYPLTLAAWANSSSSTTGQCVVCLDNSGTSGSLIALQLRGDVAGDPARLYVENASATFVTSDTTTGYTANTWQHVCGVITSDSSRAVFLNGTNKVTSTTTVSYPTLNRLQVGRRRYNGTEGLYLAGSVAEVAVWSAALTDDEVATLARGVSPLLVRPSKLVHYTPLHGRATNEEAWAGAYGLTVSGASRADHPRIVVPMTPRLQMPGATAVAAFVPRLNWI